MNWEEFQKDSERILVNILSISNKMEFCWEKIFCSEKLVLEFFLMFISDKGGSFELPTEESDITRWNLLVLKREWWRLRDEGSVGVLQISIPTNSPIWII